MKGSNAEIDESIEKMPAIDEFLRQRIEERVSLSETLKHGRGDRGHRDPGRGAGARHPGSGVTDESGRSAPRHEQGMRRFQFRLERFLELRRWKEREWELALAKVLGECLLLERRIAEIAAEVSASFLSEFRTGSMIDIDSMTRRELYVQRLARERERTQTTLAEKRVRAGAGASEIPRGIARAARCWTSSRIARRPPHYERQIDEEFKTIDDINTAAATRHR